MWWSKRFPIIYPLNTEIIGHAEQVVLITHWMLGCFDMTPARIHTTQYFTQVINIARLAIHIRNLQDSPDSV